MLVFIFCLGVLLLSHVKSGNDWILPIAAGLAMTCAIFLTMLFIFRCFASKESHQKCESGQFGRPSCNIRLILVLIAFFLLAYVLFIHFFIAPNESLFEENRIKFLTTSSSNDSYRGGRGEGNCTLNCDTAQQKLFFTGNSHECQHEKNRLVERLNQMQPEVLYKSIFLLKKYIYYK
jgi:NADH:ubiquinone oxidoreductase subunit 5 (subunit L)/multisubunit Na+/H+ antiporter MnhA subunit